MKISILTPDLSHNCLGRAYLLAKILQRHYEVEIVGPVFGDGIWEPVVGDKSIRYKSVEICGIFKPYLQIGELAKKIDGDVVYASKPLLTSFGAGLAKKLFDKKPLILDIEDNDLAFIVESYKSLPLKNSIKMFVKNTFFPYRTGSYLSAWFMEKLVKHADEITVSSRYLQNKFGGEIIWHARDTELFNPAKFNKHSVRDKYKIGREKKVAMFFGTPRVWKGIEDLIEAVSLIKNENVVLVLVGVDNNDYCRLLLKKARSLLGRRFVQFGLQPFDSVPEFLSMSDIVVIPQRKNSATIAQIPAKVFDAMAMAKPIIATRVSDLPEILGGCGWIVDPEHPKQLAKTTQDILNNPEEAEKMGRNARQKCIEKYSWDAMETKLVKIFKKYE